MSKFRGSITLSIFSLSTLSNYHYWQSPKTRYWRLVRPYQTGIPPARLLALVWAHNSDFLNSPNLKLYHHLSLSFFEKIRLPDMPKDIPRHIPIPIPAMLFNEFMKTTLQSIAAIIPIVTPIITFLIFISFIL